MSFKHNVITLVCAPAATSVNGPWHRISQYIEAPAMTLCFEVSGGTLTVEGALEQDHPHTIFTTTGDGYENLGGNKHNWEYIRAIKTSASDLGRVVARLPQ
jgi:hypothetical protein